MSKDLFRTLVPIPEAPELITPEDGVLFVGSCFAGNMGRFMEEARFPVLINPFGVLYNPLSISQCFYSLIENSVPEKEDLFYHNGLWHSFFHHGSFSNPDPSVVIKNISESTHKGHHFLQKARFVVITLGTSFVYEHNELHQVVANCHKFPESEFNRYILRPENVIDVFKDMIGRLRVFNPGLNIIFTVSPVRHLKDGAHGNQISKAVLLLAVEQLTSYFEKVWYFPAYEIVLDELRDYRFYDEAMAQPNQIAVKYIWECFMEMTLSKESRNYYRDVQRVIRARNHRQLGDNTPQYIEFLKKTLDLINALLLRYPHSLLETDRELFQKKIEEVLNY